MAGTVQYDPNFYFPAEFGQMEAKDFDYDVETESADVTYQENFESYDEPQSDDDSDLEDVDTTSNMIQVPETLTVVSQSVRTAPDGSQVVDIVIEVEDVPDAVKYDVRVTVA